MNGGAAHRRVARGADSARLSAVLAAVALVFGAHVASAHAGTIFVGTNADDGAGSSACTLGSNHKWSSEIARAAN